MQMLQKVIMQVQIKLQLHLPYAIDATMKLVGKSGASNKAGRDISIVSQTGTNIVVSGDITSFNYFVGEQYEFEYTFSQQYLALGQHLLLVLELELEKVDYKLETGQSLLMIQDFSLRRLLQ